MGGDARTWLGEHGGELIGTPGETASRRVADAGLTPRPARLGDVLTLDFRPARVTLHLDDAGRVASVAAG